MRFSNHIFLGLVFLAFFGCNSSQEKDQNLKYQLKNGESIIQKFGVCDTLKREGVSVYVSMWTPSDSNAVAREIRIELDNKLIDRINSYADSASIAKNPEAKNSIKAAHEVFEKNYTDFKKNYPEAPGCWEVELKGDSIMVTSKLMTYQIDHYSFTGGAHPNSFKSLHTFSTETGEEMEAQSFISDSVALLNKVEATFRQVEKIAPGANLEEKGYFLVNQKFFLPANFVFTREGILFYYNPYEIAPYVKGAIQFTVPYNELDGVVKKDLIF